MVVSYKIKQTKDNGVARQMKSVTVTKSSPTKPSSTVVAEEFPTPQVVGYSCVRHIEGMNAGLNLVMA
jgi:hypothetical protein